jgi:uncharacterized membrane protein
MDTRRRTLGKTVSWYIVHNGMMFIVTCALTGSWELGVTIAILQTLGEAGLYYFHERIWARVKPKKSGIPKQSEG